MVGYCLSRCSIAWKRHWSQENPYKIKNLVGGLLTVTGWSNIIMTGSMAVYMALELELKSTSWSTDRERGRHWGWHDHWNLKAQPQWHISFNKVTPSTPSNLKRSHSLVTKHSKKTDLWGYFHLNTTGALHRAASCPSTTGSKLQAKVRSIKYMFSI